MRFRLPVVDGSTPEEASTGDCESAAIGRQTKTVPAQELAASLLLHNNSAPPTLPTTRRLGSDPLVVPEIPLRQFRARHSGAFRSLRWRHRPRSLRDPRPYHSESRSVDVRHLPDLHPQKSRAPRCTRRLRRAARARYCLVWILTAPLSRLQLRSRTLALTNHAAACLLCPSLLFSHLASLLSAHSRLF